MKKTKSFRAIALLFALLLLFTACTVTEKNVTLLSGENWNDDVKTAVNDFLSEYGNSSDEFDGRGYVVFDFDNTCSVFDVSEQLAVYQLEHMCFALTPENIKEMLSADLHDFDKDLTSLGYGKGSYNDWIYDISKAYTDLYQKYGPFDVNGVAENKLDEMHKDASWQEFSTKLRVFYDLIDDNETSIVSYPWITYWFTGFTSDEVYQMATASHTEYKDKETKEVTWTSPAIDSKVGITSVTVTEGIQVTENIKELWKALRSNGIDVWVCSASHIDTIRAAVDVFGMHDYCTGVIAMTPKKVDGKIISEYDYESGMPSYARENGTWVEGKTPTKAQPQGEGKVTAIGNVCYQTYWCGPLAGFMDSTGDFNFCTEFYNLKLVVCFNRANRKVTEGGGLIAELATYQKETLGYNLSAANDCGDTLYVLQGRDENGLRTFRNSSKTIRYGETKEKLFCNEENEAQLQYMIDNKMTTADVLNTFGLKTSMKDSKLGFAYGFLEEYSGYHTK